MTRAKPTTKRKPAAQRRQEAIDSVSREERERWELTELDQRILQNTLHAISGGVTDTDPAERRDSFWDASDCLRTPAGTLKRVAAREINGLVANCASGGPVEVRACSALLLAYIATALASGGDAAPGTQRELAAKLAFLGDEVLAEVIDEFPPSQRLVFALICAPAGFARAAVLARVPEADRRDAVAIFDADHAVAKRVLDRLLSVVLDGVT